jgi:hypothetical protein
MDNMSFFKRLASVRSNSEDPSYEIDLVKSGVPMPDSEKKGENEADGPVGQLTVDIYHTPHDIVVESAIAGARPEDIDVVVASDSISKWNTFIKNAIGVNSPAPSFFLKKWIPKPPASNSATEYSPCECPRQTEERPKNSRFGWIDIKKALRGFFNINNYP